MYDKEMYLSNIANDIAFKRVHKLMEVVTMIILVPMTFVMSILGVGVLFRCVLYLRYGDQSVV